MMNTFQVENSSHVNQSRRFAASLVKVSGFNETQIEHVSIVTTELANNLINHADGGILIFQIIHSLNSTGLEILSLDKGPGIKNLEESLQDGFSTRGSQGTGLGAIRRLSSEFNIYSDPDSGLAVMSRIWDKNLPIAAPPDQIEVGAVCLPVLTEEVCGDSWTMHQSPGRIMVMVADGLGHGPLAAEASNLAVKIFNKYTDDNPSKMLERLHIALKPTRGAAVAIAEILPKQGILNFTGLGNISGNIFSATDSQSLISLNGTVGVVSRTIREFQYQWPQDGLLILHSDGLKTHCNINEYRNLRNQHPSLIAGVLYRDNQRIRDDSTVIVLRSKGQSQ